MPDRFRAIANSNLAGHLSACLLLIALAGCHRSQESNPTESPAASVLAVDEGFRQTLFEHAVDNLDRLEQFQPQAMLEQIVEQLNQSVDWNRDVDWQPDPLLTTLPAEVQKLPLLESLDDLKLSNFDTSHLQEVVTLGDVAQSATRDTGDDLERATRLFDWTVRNIEFPQDNELGADGEGRPVQTQHLPFQTLFFGRGGPLDRAWTFILLARQQDLDAVLLAVRPSAEAPLQPWCVGVLIGGDLYLYDPSLGLPIPGPGNKPVATLAEAATDESVLRRLDLDEEHPYPLTMSVVSSVTALVEASPGYLSRRMRVLSSRMTGEHKLALTTQPNLVVDRVKKCAHVGDVQLWMLPFQRRAVQGSPEAMLALQREVMPYVIDLLPEAYRPVAGALQRGRILHLKGILAAEEEGASANRFYQAARLADKEIDIPALNPQQRLVLHRGKDDASYWLGLVAFERGRYQAAIDHFQKRTIEVESQEGNSGRWTAGAYYNLGRAHEALGQIDEAAKAYTAAPDRRQSYGNRLRARLLEETKSRAGKPEV